MVKKVKPVSIHVKLKTSDGALREGLLYDHIGRLRHDDARQRSVEALANRYNVDQNQAARVAESASAMLVQVGESWALESPLAASLLDWAARLHEIGLDISHDNFQSHGAYVAENADLPGFPRSEQLLLSYLIATQRKQFDAALGKALPGAWRPKALHLAVLLRIAVLLNRSRGSAGSVDTIAQGKNRALHLLFPDGWLSANPLTVTDLDREKSYLQKIGFELEYE